MPNIEDVLGEWYQRVSVTQLAHYRSAGHFARKKYWLGVPAVVLATIVGTSVFASLADDQPNVWLQIGIGLASVTAAVLTSLQTFLGYSERAEKHRIAGAKYGALGREMETLRASIQDVTKEQIDRIRERLDTLAIESPNNPETIYKKAGSGTLAAPDVVPND
nr:putative integron gene cassette protein [uncultured bacterium]CAP48639.1 putative integron gene cassette protein [uncultured bacterium]CAP48646.1 putative integron gene cassette protein [uncultured bacterium]